MKNEVKYSLYSKIITFAIIGLCIFVLCQVEGYSEKNLIAGSILIIAILVGLYYCPISVEADTNGIRVHRFLSRPKTFNYADIESVDTCYPSAGGIRLCGSAGLFGYWGYFSDIMIGTYFGYYGSRSYCFLLKLKSGRQYVIGCENPVEMVSYINTNLLPQ